MTEPAFVRESSAPADLAASQGWISEVITEFRQSGATWMRVSFKPDRSRMIVEAWVERPDDEGPVRWADIDGATALEGFVDDMVAANPHLFARLAQGD